MKMKRKILKFCSMLLVPFMLTLNCPLMASEISKAVDSTAAGVTTEITYSPEDKAIAGQRIPIQLEVKDDKGVDVVRIYFRVANAKSYVYVTLNKGGNTFTGILPSPANGAGEIDYLILVKNKNNQIVKSQNYQLPVIDASDAKLADIAANNEKIEVYTETMEAPSSLEGFTDNITINLTKSAAKYGVKAGLYSGVDAGSSTTTAVSAGTVTAFVKEGISTTTTVIAGAGVVVVAGVAVAAAGGSSDDDGGSGGTGSGIVGGWHEVSNSMSEWQKENWTFGADGSFTWAEYEGPMMMSGGGSYTASGNSVTVNHDGAGSFNCTMSGASMTCTYSLGSNALTKM